MSPIPVISSAHALLSSAITTLASTTTAASPASIALPLEIRPRAIDEPYEGMAPHKNPTVLCDWTRNASYCRDADFIQWILIVSSILHVVVGFYGIWLLSYRNRGFNLKIITELFSSVGAGIRPKPMDCIVFFTTVACFVKVPANLPLIFNVLEDHWWFRIAIEQLYWLFVSFAFASYFVGLLYAMPVTAREGMFAVYQPESVFGTKTLPPIHVISPTTAQKNAMLIIGAIYPAIFGAGLGIASGAFYDRGQYRISRILLLAQYSNWVLILWSMALMFFYYGLKYTFILRANIIIAETALKAPRAAFGLGNLISRSPARFLFIQLQITGFGGCAVTVLAGALCMIWVLFQEGILSMPRDEWPHTMGFFWTCAIAVAFFVLMALVTAQSIRNRRRGLHEPSTATTNSLVAPGGSSGGQRNKGSKPDAYSLHLNSYNSRGSKFGTPRTDPEEVCLTHEGSSADASTLHSLPLAERCLSMERRYRDLPDQDLEAALARSSFYNEDDEEEEHDRVMYKTPSLTPPPRPHFSGRRPSAVGLNDTQDGNSTGGGPLTSISSNSSSGSSTGVGASGSMPRQISATHPSQIRESVFGGRTPREDGRGSHPASPPLSPTTTISSGGFMLAALPRSSLRSGSRNSVVSRPSTSSATSGSYNINNNSYHTTSIPATGISGRHSTSHRAGGSQNQSVTSSVATTSISRESIAEERGGEVEEPYQEVWTNRHAHSMSNPLSSPPPDIPLPTPPEALMLTGTGGGGGGYSTHSSPYSGQQRTQPIPAVGFVTGRKHSRAGIPPAEPNA